MIHRVLRSGVMEDVRGLGPHNHVCWAYEDPEDLRYQVRESLAEGQRVYYVASGDAQSLVKDLRDLAGLAGTPPASHHQPRHGGVPVAHWAGCCPRLRTAWPGVSRMIELLDLEDVRVEPPP